MTIAALATLQDDLGGCAGAREPVEFATGVGYGIWPWRRNIR